MTANGVNRHIGNAIYDFCEQGSIIFNEICFGQNNDRLAAALPDLGQIPHNTGNVEIQIERSQDKYIIKVGCDNLLPDRFGVACGMPGVISA
ncbi:hypothetical protein D3C80_1710270 [compost metagenome]